jgi:hypothetical protein
MTILCPICRQDVRSESFTRPTALTHAIAIHMAHLKISITPVRIIPSEPWVTNEGTS